MQAYFTAVLIFYNEVKGKPALALSRDLAMQQKTAWVLSHKLREAMSTEVKGYKLGGVGKTVEVDGAYFDGSHKLANHKEHRRDRRLAHNQNGKRQCTVVIRERGRGDAIRIQDEGLGHLLYPPARRRWHQYHDRQCHFVEYAARP